MTAIFFALLLAMAADANARSIIVTGKVVDEHGEALIGAGVVSKDGKRGAVTDVNGQYSITLNESDKVLSFSFIGYTTQEVDIAGKKTVDVILLPDASNTLNDVVVIGYGTTKKQDLTGSVATVKMSDIQSSPVVSVDQALQGRIAGVDIMSTSGDPSASTSIRVRGTRSITASNEPLIIVDGIMDAVSDFGDINPDDVESISVLKDASSTAIYGSRGSNGVIMVTTKKGSTAKPSIRAKATFGVSTIAKKLDIMNAEEFIRYRNDIAFGNGKDASKFIPKYDPDNYLNDTDWIDAITRVAKYQNYSVSASGKGKDYNYYASLSYTDNEGIVKSSGQKRASGRLNFSKQFFKWLTVDFKLSTTYRHKDRNKAVFSGSGYSNGAIYLAPVLGLLDNQNPFIENSTLIDTPYASILHEDYFDKSWSNQGSIEFTVKPIKGMVIKSQNSITNGNSHTYHFWPNALPSRKEQEGAKGYKYEKESEGYASENTLTYNFKVGKGHNFQAMAGYSVNLTQSSNTAVTAKGLINDDLKWNNLNGVSSSDGYTVTSGGQRILRQSVFGRFNYNYRGRYYVTATARADGSSNFADNRKWGFFPSAALKWNMKKENFLRRVQWVDDMNIRLSAGVTGNDAISAYRSQQAYTSTTSSYIFDGTQGVSFYPSRLASPDLTWEKTTQYNVAYEFSALKNRINIEIDAYYSLTSDLLLSVKTMGSTGYPTKFANIGTTSNKGIEFTLNTHNIETKNFGWSTTFTISHNKQMVEDIGNESYVSCVSDPDGFMMYGYRAGYPLNAMWGFKYGGCVHSEDEFNENIQTKQYVYRTSYTASNSLGQPRYIDKDHDGVLTQDDSFYLGNADPYVYGGLQNTFNWKKLQLSVYLAYSIGGKIYNYSELFMAGGSYTNQYRFMLDCWHPVRNPDGYLPRAGTNRWVSASDLMIYDASFLRLKDVSLQYTFDMPKKFKVFRELTLGIVGSNLWLWSKYRGFDPDVSTEYEDSTLRRVDKNSYPSSRKVALNLNIRF